MGVLDDQSVPSEAAKRRRARRDAVDADRSSGTTTGSMASVSNDGDRRRPQRGLFVNATRAEDHYRASRGRSATDVLWSVGRWFAIALFVPVQFLIALSRPRAVARQISQAPSRLRSNVRRWRMAAQERGTVAGTMQQFGRSTQTFVVEEWDDMRDGFPSAEELLNQSLQWGKVQLATWRVQLRPGPALWHQIGAASGVAAFAFAVLFGLFVAVHNGFERLARGDRLPLARIDIIGVEQLAESDVRRLLAVRPGDNLLNLDPAQIRARVEQNPWLRDVEVHLDLAAAVLSVRVAERRADLVLAGTPARLVDERGEAFKVLRATDPVDLPVLSGLAPDASPEVVAQVATYAREALSALDQGGGVGRKDVAEVLWHEDDGVSVLVRGGPPIRLGRTDFHERIARLRRALQAGKLPLQAVATVDLSLSDRMVVVPKLADAGRAVRKRLDAQGVSADHRARLLALEQERRGLVPAAVP